MEFFIEIIFRWLIVRVFGVYTRFMFYKLTGKKRTIEQLLATDKSEENNFSEDFYNAFIGLIVFCAISVLIAYLVFS